MLSIMHVVVGMLLCQNVVATLTYVKLNITSARTHKSEIICVNYQPSDRTVNAKNITIRLKLPFAFRIIKKDSEICLTDNSTLSLNREIILDNTFGPHDDQCPSSYYTNLTIRILDAQFHGAGAMLLPRDQLHSTYQAKSLNSKQSFMEMPLFYITDKNLDRIKQLNGRWPLENDVKVQMMPSNGFRYWNAVIIIIIAVICVALGGLWSGYTTIDVLKRANIASTIECEKPEPTEKPLTYCGLCIMMSSFIVVLLSLYYFYDYLVWIMIFLYIWGSSFAIHTCLLNGFRFPFGDACQHPQFDFGNCISTYICCWCKCAKDEFKNIICTPINFLLYGVSISICIGWFVMRKNLYAFIWHDLISMVFCIYLINNMRIQNLKAITLIFSVMFIYDLFMVFISPFFTSGGCSIMIKAATGECAPTVDVIGFPDPNKITPPPSLQQKEPMPVMFHVVDIFYPMKDCFDYPTDITTYPKLALGFGDVVVPGLLIGFNHACDLAWNNKSKIYYFAGLFGYVVGLILTFIALLLMEMGQPALIYLVPCTLLCTYTVALIKNQFGPMWRGELMHTEVSILVPIETPSESATGSSTNLQKVPVNNK